MESENKNIVVKRSLFTRLTGKLSIRSKLVLAFMIMIALTLAVSGVTLVFDQISQKTRDELIDVQVKVGRLSLETENSLRVMQSLEKEFLLKQASIGIQEAKVQYLVPFTEMGGQTYATLYEIQQLLTSQADIEAAQSAMDSINEYLSAFIGTVNILELRVDKEFGELVKLDAAIEAFDKEIDAHDDIVIEDNAAELFDAIQEYRFTPTKEGAADVTSQLANVRDLVEVSLMPAPTRQKITEQLDELANWFNQVKDTDAELNARVEAYEEAAKKAEPVIDAFLLSASNNQQAATKKMQDTSTLTRQIVIGVSIAAILLGILIAIVLSKSLTEQVNHIVDLLGEIGMGNFDARTPVVTQDELGTMADALNAMLDNITILIQSQTERDAIQESIMKLLEEISALTEGDLRGRAEVTEDMTGAIADSFNAMTEQFSDIILQVKKATGSVDLTSEDVTKQTMSLANKNIEQAHKVEDAIGAIDHMVNSIKEVSENAQKSAEVSEKSRLNAREGAEAVQKTNTAMSEIREEINETARSIKRLGESSLEIGNVVQIINELSDRTSILALNASIQAAMAGDAGHGFAVVADEVQRLAESSGNSTKQIETLVNNIQTEIKNVSNRMDESIGKVVQGSQLADGAHEKLQQIEDVSQNLADLIDAITDATNEQVRVSEQISGTMQEVGDVSKESSISSQETATSMDALRTTAQELRAAVEMFKIAEESEETV